MIEYEIKDALLKKGCPVCSVLKKRTDEVLWWFEKENYHEIETLSKLHDNPFICERHKEKLLVIGNTLSVTFEFLIEKDMEFLSSLSKLKSKKLSQKVKHSSFDSCMFCALEKDIERFIVEKFIEMLKENETKKLYEKSEGLCRKHLFECLLKADKAQESTEFLIRDAVLRLSKIDKLLKEFFHKSDYRFSGEKKGKEQNAWIDALNFYSANKK